MNHIKCVGNEMSLEDCQHRDFDGIGSGHNAGVECIAHGEK